MEDLVKIYDLLVKIYRDKAYSSIELSKVLPSCLNKQFTTKLTYGVLEKDVELTYYINMLTSKKPQNAIAILLKMGIYCIKYMDSCPDYAVVDNFVDLTGLVGKKQLKGFVNSVLKSFCNARPDYPTAEKDNLSVSTSTPLWLVKEYIKQYGLEKTKEFLSVKHITDEHIRPNLRKLSLEELAQKLDNKQVPYRLDDKGGMFVTNNSYIQDMFDAGYITYQSLTSMICAQAVDIQDGMKVLDVCSAPGGKAVYLSELANDAEIVACDIHEHRIELINKYIYRMQAKNIETQYNDATVYREAFANKFDRVLCDVPCSGFGVAGKKPDIYIDSSPEKVNALALVQYDILRHSARYLKENGVLIYSTCTTLRQENYNIVGKFVKEYRGFEVVEFTQYLPDDKGGDGFFIAKIRRKND
ncbi:MAG: 16S rRNA (cytosine(967)-C(5))-methyltransferase RsmB [Clostridia bacterium]